MSFSFTFDGRPGRVDDGNFVRWGGMSFQIEAAGPQLRAAIETARGAVHPVFTPILGQISPPSVMIEIPRVCIEEAIRAMADANSIMRESRPSTWSPSLTEQRLHYAIEELKQCANQR